MVSEEVLRSQDAEVDSSAVLKKTHEWGNTLYSKMEALEKRFDELMERMNEIGDQTNDFHEWMSEPKVVQTVSVVQDPDRIEVGTPTTGKVLVAGDARNLNDFMQRADNALKVLADVKLRAGKGGV